MNSRFHLISPRALALASAAYAAALPAIAYTVRGQFIESDSGLDCPNTLYRIYSEADSVHPAVSNVSDINGRFTQEISKAGNYTLHAVYAGTADLSVTFSVSDSKPAANLDTLRFMPLGEQLGELLVVARKKLIENDGATLTYNVSEDPQSQSSSTLDMLRRVPMVTVDAQENIKIKGQSDFKVFLNGKEDPMLSGDVKTILKSMPASSIKKIEVITEPGAKYDAEGSGGILNIITTSSKSLEGFLLNLSGHASTNGAGASAYARTKIGNVTGSANINYFGFNIFDTKSTFREALENLESDSERYQTRLGTIKNRGHFTSADLNLSWEPDTINLYTISLRIADNIIRQKSSDRISMQDEALNTVWQYSRELNTRYPNLGMSAAASYQHNFSNDGHYITGTYLFDYGYNNSDSRQRHFDMENFVPDFIWNTTRNDINYRKHTIQADYANRFSPKHLLEAGAKAALRNNRAAALPSSGDDEDMLIPDMSQKVSFTQFEDIAAVYASYTGTFGKFGAKAGLRYEYTHMGSRYRAGDYTDFTTELNDIVPNAALTFTPSAGSTLRLAYQMRITRPTVDELNPYRNTLNVNTVNAVLFGNPDLKSERNNQIGLTYSNYGGKLGGNIGISYAHTANSIESYQFMKDGIVNRTYANIGKCAYTSLDGYLSWNPMAAFSAGLYFNGYYADYRADSPELKAKRHIWGMSVNLNADYTFPFKLRISGYAGGGSPWADLQSRGQGWYYYGLSLSRSFLKNDQLTVTAYANNFIPPVKKNSFTTKAEGMETRTSFSYRQINAGISLAWKFGSLKSDVKRTSAEIESIKVPSVTNSGTHVK